MALDDVKRVLARAAELKAALEDAGEADPTASRLADLLQTDIALLEAASRSGDADELSAGLMFPSLDARAADSLGGFEMDVHPKTRHEYAELNNAIVEALESLDLI
ncbi:hypothetical protein [Hoeflea ulvae]|uniref:Uncharacterized protein n=1 Tax=Hoeflea ulvae TaxID=2983764 RepID=A0ABT3YH24_9HYPH|nr:hypothetical protein [Hoeflea ulvae]MCY0095181.1 hypothetical protein [Hoeflea ulvae]